MKRKFDILTDSGCDMPKSYLEENGVTCVRLGFTLDGTEYEGENGEQMEEKSFYQKLRDGAMPTTYQITCETARAYMEKSLQAGRDLLVVAFSSALSGTAESFALAKKQLQKKYPKRKIFVVDSLCASMGEGLLLDYVIKKADTGAEIEETADFAEQLKKKICHHFTVDNLFHLKRGGRINATSAIVGSILKIKPIMHVDDNGKLVALSKVIGRKKALKTLVDNVVKSAEMEAGEPIFISHGDCEEDVRFVETLLKQSFPRSPITVHYVGTVIGSHSGAGTLAVFHKGAKR